MALPRGARLAAALWIVFAIVAWNVVFDRVIVVAGRTYVASAARAVRGGGAPLLISDWMSDASGRAVWWATAVGGGIAVVGLSGVAWALRARTSTPKFHVDSPDSSAEDAACAPPSIR